MFGESPEGLRERRWRTAGKGHSGNKAFTRWKDNPISSHGTGRMLYMTDLDFISEFHKDHPSDFRKRPSLLGERPLGGGESLSRPERWRKWPSARTTSW